MTRASEHSYEWHLRWTAHCPCSEHKACGPWAPKRKRGNNNIKTLQSSTSVICWWNLWIAWFPLWKKVDALLNGGPSAHCNSAFSICLTRQKWTNCNLYNWYNLCYNQRAIFTLRRDVWNFGTQIYVNLNLWSKMGFISELSPTLKDSQSMPGMVDVMQWLNQLDWPNDVGVNSSPFTCLISRVHFPKISYRNQVRGVRYTARKSVGGPLALSEKVDKLHPTDSHPMEARRPIQSGFKMIQNIQEYTSISNYVWGLGSYEISSGFSKTLLGNTKGFGQSLSKWCRGKIGP